MTREIVLRPSPLDRRQLLAAERYSRGHGNSRPFAEVAGVTTAGCAAIACCCPGGIATLLVLAVYKLPAGLVRRALRMQRRRRRLKRRSTVMIDRQKCECGYVDRELGIHTMRCGGSPMVYTSMEMDEDIMELEREMWGRFYGTGFWRSLSQRAD